MDKSEQIDNIKIDGFLRALPDFYNTLVTEHELTGYLLFSSLVIWIFTFGH